MFGGAWLCPGDRFGSKATICFSHQRNINPTLIAAPALQQKSQPPPSTTTIDIQTSRSKQPATNASIHARQKYRRPHKAA